MSTKHTNRPARNGGRAATGQIIEHRGKVGQLYGSLRFGVGGKRSRHALGAVSLDDARTELDNLMADARRGVWQPPTEAPEPPAEIPTFHELAERNGGRCTSMNGPPRPSRTTAGGWSFTCSRASRTTGST